MSLDDQYRQWKADADLLAQIGQALFSQPSRIEVRLPIELARRASLAWGRDDGDAILPTESYEERQVRHSAGFLGLVGLAVDEGAVAEGDSVIISLNAWTIGAAFDAADEAGLLAGVQPPRS